MTTADEFAAADFYHIDFISADITLVMHIRKWEGKHMELLCKEAYELGLKVLPLLRKFDVKTGMPPPDLLDIPKEK